MVVEEEEQRDGRLRALSSRTMLNGATCLSCFKDGGSSSTEQTLEVGEEDDVLLLEDISR